MVAVTESRTPGCFILTEANGRRSRKKVTVTVPATTTLLAGEVLSTAAGKFVDYDDAVGGGIATAILFDTLVNATGAPVDMVGVIVDNNAEVVKSQLLWKAGVSAGAKLTGLADLELVHIKALDGPA